MKTTDQLRAELREAEAREAEAREAQRQSTPIIRQYTLLPVEPDRWNPLFDEDSGLYRLASTVLNREEAEKAGHHGWDLDSGGMTYAYNRLSGRLICPVGGGTIYYSDPAKFDLLSQFLREHPEGGDVTEIMKGV